MMNLSNKPPEYLKLIETRLMVLKDNRIRSSFAKKYLAPFEDNTLMEKKIKKLKPMEEFTGLSANGDDIAKDLEVDTQQKDEPYIPIENLEDQDSMLGDNDKDVLRDVPTNRPVKKLMRYEVKLLKNTAVSR